MQGALPPAPLWLTAVKIAVNPDSLNSESFSSDTDLQTFLFGVVAGDPE
jgi:hypothetical protein